MSLGFLVSFISVATVVKMQPWSTASRQDAYLKTFKCQRQLSLRRQFRQDQYIPYRPDTLSDTPRCDCKVATVALHGLQTALQCTISTWRAGTVLRSPMRPTLSIDLLSSAVYSWFTCAYGCSGELTSQLIAHIVLSCQNDYRLPPQPPGGPLKIWLVPQGQASISNYSVQPIVHIVPPWPRAKHLPTYSRRACMCTMSWNISAL